MATAWRTAFRRDGGGRRTVKWLLQSPGEGQAFGLVVKMLFGCLHPMLSPWFESQLLHSEPVLANADVRRQQVVAEVVWVPNAHMGDPD